MARFEGFSTRSTQVGSAVLRSRNQMGDLSHISDRAIRWVQRACLVGLTLFAVQMAIPAYAVSADEPSSDRSVSTSPQERPDLDAADVQRLDGQSLDGPPLTRAANQRQIDEMSPAGWLSRFGRVSIGLVE
jgi:hypothetical protein